MRIVVLALVVFGLTLAACGDSGGESEPAPQTNEAASSEETSEPDDSSSAPELLLSVTNGNFNPDPLRLVADSPTELPFLNNDPAPHNLAIYVSKGGKNLFKGNPVDGDERTIYSLPPLKSGRYYITCEIHPSMEATALAK